jgi:hypothetical protein
MELEVRSLVQLRVCMSRAYDVCKNRLKAGKKCKVNVGLRQGYVMSPWLCNIFIDGW